jgi:hypothetical protein
MKLALIRGLKPTNKIGWLFLLVFCLSGIYQVYDAINTLPLFFREMTQTEQNNWQENFNRDLILGFSTSILGIVCLIGYIFHVVKNYKN